MGVWGVGEEKDELLPMGTCWVPFAGVKRLFGFVRAGLCGKGGEWPVLAPGFTCQDDHSPGTLTKSHKRGPERGA